MFKQNGSKWWIFRCQVWLPKGTWDIEPFWFKQMNENLDAVWKSQPGHTGSTHIQSIGDHWEPSHDEHLATKSTNWESIPGSGKKPVKHPMVFKVCRSPVPGSSHLVRWCPMEPLLTSPHSSLGTSSATGGRLLEEDSKQGWFSSNDDHGGWL